MRKLFLLALLIFPSVAMAIEKPPEIVAQIHTSSPVGTAGYHKLFLHVYDASFWSDSGGWKQFPYALTVTYTMDIDAVDLADHARDDMAHSSDLSEAQRNNYRDQLMKLWPDVDEGDRITALADKDGGTTFFYNGSLRGRISDPQFTHAFFGMWLSDRSAEPEMRAKLLHLE